MTDKLGRYYTEDRISKLLVSSFLKKNPKIIFELGVGRGSLIKAAYKRWRDASFVAYDVDSTNFSYVKNKIEHISIHRSNCLEDPADELESEIGVDIAVCNPPFKKLKKKLPQHEKLLLDTGFNLTNSIKEITTDIIFLVKNLRLLSPDGELGIILPDTLLTGDKYKKFRQDLVRNSTIKSIIQLPPKIFKKTEALTHIVTLKNKKTKSYKVPLKLSNKQGIITSQLVIDSKDLIERMDFNYFKMKKRIKCNGRSLSELGAEIFRGALSKAKLKEVLGVNNFFHLSDFDNKKFNTKKEYKTISKYAIKGDIIISRIGKRSLGKITYIETGSIEISDCVFVIRIESHYRKSVLKALKSKYGKDWVKAKAHGVCSQFITKSDLLSFKVPGT